MPFAAGECLIHGQLRTPVRPILCYHHEYTVAFLGKSSLVIYNFEQWLE